MSGEKKALAELVEDLGRRTGAGLEECVLVLLSKGKNGHAEVAGALDGPRGELVAAVIGRRAAQVVEFLGTTAGGLESEPAARIFAEIPPETLRNRAWAFLDRGQSDEAMFLAELARGRGVTHEYPWLMARIHLSRGDLGPAHSFYEEALRIAPLEARPDVLVDRTRAYLDLGDSKEAWESLSWATADPMDAPTLRVVEGLLGEVLWAMTKGTSPAPEALGALLGGLGTANWAARAVRAAIAETKRAARLRYDWFATANLELRESVERITLSALRAREEGFDQGKFLEVESRALQARKLAEDFLRGTGDYPHGLNLGEERGGSLDSEDPMDLAHAFLQAVREEWGSGWEVVRGRLLELGERVRHAVLEAVPSSTGGQARIDDMDGALWRALGSAWAMAACLEMLKPVEKTYRMLGPVVEAALQGLDACFRLSGSAPVVRLGALPEVQMDSERFKAGLAILTCVTAEVSPGVPIGFAACLKEETQEVEISLGPSEGDGKNTWSEMPEDVRLALTIAREVFASHEGRVLQKTSCYRVTVPQSTVERDLSRTIPDYPNLSDSARQALKAAEAIVQEEGASGDIRMSAFLYLKALEIEMEQRLAPYLERHKLLPKALNLAKDPSSWDSLLAGAYAPEPVPQGASGRLAGLLKAIEKDRISREVRDWNALGLLLTVFYDAPSLRSLGRDLDGLESLRAWAGGSSSKGRPPADVTQAFQRAKEATIKGLEHLAGMTG